MHLTPQTLAAVASSPWIIPNPLLHNTVLGVALTFSFNASLTCSIQHTFDDPTATPRPMTYTRAGTVLTIVDQAHNLIVGDNISITQDSAFNGAYDIATIVDANTYTVTVPNSGPLNGSAVLQSFRVFNADDARLVGVTGAPPNRVDGNYNSPVSAVRLKVTAYTAGTATLTVQQGLGN